MTGPYGRWIADYRNGGLHPFPVDGKRPCVTSYAKGRPSVSTTERWAQAFPHANLGLPTRREGLAVLDADDFDMVAVFEAVAGFTPLRVATRRGEHWYFVDPRREIASVNHPSGQPFDIKAAGPSSFVLIPGSEYQGGVYGIVDYTGTDHAAEFCRRLQDLPSLSSSAYRELRQQPQRLVQGRRSPMSGSNTIFLHHASIPQGARNGWLFKASCREAHDIRQRHGDGEEGLATLTNHISAFNSQLCDPPLDTDEVEKLVAGVWARTLSGVNRQPPREKRYVREILRRTGKHVRSLALWGWLSQGEFDPDEMELAPARIAAAIPGWKPHDAIAAIKGLVEQEVLRQERPGRRKKRPRTPVARPVGNARRCRAPCYQRTLGGGLPARPTP